MTVNDETGFIVVEGDDAPVIEFAEADVDADDDAIEELETLISALKESFEDMVITVSYTAAVEDDETTPETDESADAEFAAAIEGLPSATFSAEEAGANGDGVIELTITDAAEDIDVATVTINVDVDTEAEDGSEATITFAIPLASAKIETAVSRNEDAYVYANTADLGENDDEPDEALVTSKGYYWKQVVEDDADYPAISFKLVGDINGDPEEGDPLTVWDSIGTDITFDLIWDIKAYDTTVNRPFGDGATGDEEDEPQEPTGELPTVELLKAATGTTAAKGAQLTWTPGTEDYEDYEPVKIVYTTSSGAAEADLTVVDDTTVKFTANSAIKGGSDHMVIFQVDGDEATQIEVELPDGCW